MSNINVLVTFEAKAESAQQFAALLSRISKELPNVDGCNHASARVRDDNPQRFMIFEEWESQAKHKTHIESVINSGTWDEIAKHLASAPVTHYYRQI